ncbi:MAG TPA: DUF2461 domain-containing protein [Acidimicrobiia bacterium]|nr:DUF2461 domain-containing protein [Acidimicrobiia bacterium]
MAFRGWPAEAIEFFEGLEADNSRTYWQANKPVYEEVVRGPMDELLVELAPEYGEGRIFRPYRDVRFSQDKSPYKTSIAATLARGGYISLSTEGLSAGQGLYMPASDQLERYRRAVADNRSGRQLVDIVAKLRKGGITVDAHDVLKTAPKGYPKDHPRIELLRYKGLISWKQWSVGAWLGTRKSKDRLVAFLRASRPLHDWLEKRVGPSQLADEG